MNMIFPRDMRALQMVESGILSVFDVVIVINLDSRTDRLAEMGEQLRKAGLTFDDDRVIRLSASRPDDRGEFRTIGARGCFESHMHALNLALQRKARSVLILEDDCDFRGNVSDVMQCLRSNPWNVFSGGYSARTGEPPVRDLHLPVAAVQPETGLVSAHCLGFRGAAIRHARDYLKVLQSRKAGDPMGGPMDVDAAYNWFRNEYRYTTLVSDPMIAVQRSSRSDITVAHWFDRVPVLRTLAEFGRKLKRSLR